MKTKLFLALILSSLFVHYVDAAQTIPLLSIRAACIFASGVSVAHLYKVANSKGLSPFQNLNLQPVNPVRKLFFELFPLSTLGKIAAISCVMSFCGVSFVNFIGAYNWPLRDRLKITLAFAVVPCASIATSVLLSKQLLTSVLQ